MEQAIKEKIGQEKRIYRILKMANKVCPLLIALVAISWVDTRFIFKDEQLSLFFNLILIFASLIFVITLTVFTYRYNQCVVANSFSKRDVCTCLMKDEKISWIEAGNKEEKDG